MYCQLKSLDLQLESELQFLTDVADCSTPEDQRQRLNRRRTLSLILECWGRHVQQIRARLGRLGAYRAATCTSEDTVWIESSVEHAASADDCWVCETHELHTASWQQYSWHAEDDQEWLESHQITESCNSLLLLLHSAMTCRGNWNSTYHLAWNVLPHYLVKLNV